ncbi:MAG: glycosyltransferase, partial [Verrucomicrobiales bacterium]|nr:glycosyltransferase [Verrucomicrobiales bacterium]
MTPPLPQLAILIVNWRSKDYVRRCLETVRNTGAALRLQIIVVDGASFDGCAEMLRDEFPEVEFVQ